MSASVATMGRDFEEEEGEVSQDVYVRRSQARQRQITIGKSRPEYKLYANTVPFHRRTDTEHMPQTPDPHARISKRAFDRELACWRRGLHVWSGHVEGVRSMDGHSPKRTGGHRDGASDERPKWADFCPSKDWSPAGTESTRADSEASTSPARPHCQTPGAQAAADAKLWNVKLNLFEHLSPPVLPQVTAPTSSASVAAMPQMLPAMAATAPWEFPTALNAAPMGGLPLVQFGGAEQQQQQPCAYTMGCGWGEPLPWTQPAMQQSQPAMTMTFEQQPALQMQPIESMAVAETQIAQSLMWQSSAPQQPLPGTPRASKNQAEEAPRTPLITTRVGFSATSPAVTSPWLRTPSPDHMRHYMSAQQHQICAPQSAIPEQQVAIPEQQADPWAGTTLMVATRSYFAESDGYLSVGVGSPVRAMIETPHCGDAKCSWPMYVYCSQGNSMGWVPLQILWRCYVDDAGRRWASDDATGTWCWVDEMEMSNQQV